jgi:hypothetical protein
MLAFSWDSLSLHRVGGSKVQVAGWCVYVSVLWLVKASLCAFYARLTVCLLERRRHDRFEI